MSSAPKQQVGGDSSVFRGSIIPALRNSYGSKETLDRADSYVSRFIYRRWSFYLTVPFVWMGWSANQVTILRAVLALLSAVLVATGFRTLVVFGASLYALCVLLDYVDGNLARLYGTAGDFGALLEELADQVGPALFPLAIGVGLYLRPDRLLRLMGHVDPVWPLLAGALASIAYCLGAMTLLYIRVMKADSKRQGDLATRSPDSRASMGSGVNTLRWGRTAVIEGVYFAIVFGVVLAAIFDIMSIYLVARGLKNFVILFLWMRILVRRLAELRADAGP